MRIILGAPCAGKGSQSLFLSKKYDIVHISAGTLLRKKYPPHTEERKMLDEGNFICPTRVDELVKEELLKHNFNVLLDGYPRTVGQAEFIKYLLNKHNITIKEIFVLECPKDELMRRTSFRTICDNCEQTFISNSVCCGIRTTVRRDDKLEILEKRYDTFIESFYKIQPIIQGPFYFINGRQLPEQISSNICKIIDGNIERLSLKTQ